MCSGCLFQNSRALSFARRSSRLHPRARYLLAYCHSLVALRQATGCGSAAAAGGVDDDDDRGGCDDCDGCDCAGG